MQAQEQEIPPPTAPFVAPVPDSISWKMAFSKPKRAEGAKPDTDPTKQLSGDRYVRTVDVIKSGTLRREITVWSNGFTAQSWVVDGLNVSEDPSKELVIMPVAGSSKEKKDGVADFPLFSWINLKNYKGVEEIGGKKCYAYKQAVPMTQVAPGYFATLPGMSSQASAYVAVDTGLPVAVRVDDITIAYTFGPGSDTPLSVPDKFKQSIVDYQKAEQRMVHRPSAQ